VQKWLKQQYPGIKAIAQKQHGLVLWLDELGLRSQHQAGKSFALKGKTPVLQKSGQRFYLNEISAMSNRGHLVFMVVDGNFNGSVFLAFLNKLVKSFRQKVFLIADRHPAHKTKGVKQWLAANSQSIELFFLPPYSPELNPDEYFNQALKTNIVGKARPRHKQELKTIVTAFSIRKKNNPKKVKKYFHAKTVNYAL
jgi:transposase